MWTQADVRIKHQAGRHDQKTHTPKKYGIVSSTLPTEAEPFRNELLGYGDDRERLILVDSQGNVLDRVVGTEGEEVATSSNLRLRDSNEKLTSHHNHPWDAPPSQGDVLRLGLEPGLSDIYVHSSEASYHVAPGVDRDTLYRATRSAFGSAHNAELDKLLFGTIPATDETREAVRRRMHVATSQVALEQLAGDGVIYYQVYRPTKSRSKACDCAFKTSPWQAIRLYRLAGIQLKQEGGLPDSIAALADGTTGYEAEIRTAWDAYKLDPTPKKAEEFIDYLMVISGVMWPEVMAAVLGIAVDELTVDQQQVLQDALDEHHAYMRESLLPDITRYQQLGKLDSLDYRTIVLYAGALWQFGNLATVMFDGTKLRDLADLFMFAGPNDSETCTGERGCQSHANRVYTVAQILTEEIIPGRMRCLTNCRHFLLPLASPLKGVKHQMGRHDQRTHTPEAYRGRGVVPEKPGPKPYVPERVRELMDPDSDTNTQAAKDWNDLSHADRMKLADPDAMDRGMAENLRRYREEVEIPHDLKGQKLTTKTYDQVAVNTQARIDSLQGALTPVTEAQLREYADTHMRKAVEQGLKDKSLKMDAGQLDDMMAKNIDKLAHQEIEARKRQLGDHGIRHVVGNIRAVDAMLDDPDLPATTGLQRMMALQTMVDHDMGYTVGVVAKSIPATEYHPQYSEKYAKAQGYEKLFGAGEAKEMTRMVREHAETDLDWKGDTLMSVVRTADNTALFNREKLPALFYDVPGATDELYKLQLAQVGGTGKQVTPKVQENLRKLVEDSGIDDRHKAELLMAVDEVSPYTGKFSLGMAAGEIEGYDYANGVMGIKVVGKPERELLNGLFDLGDRQFDKFAEAYDTTGNPSVGGLDFSKGGKKVLHIDYEEPTRKATGTLATMYDDSVRPDIRQASRQAGPVSTLTDRERAWPMIQANVKGKLTAGEMAEFERRFKAGTLDDMPLTERERSYLTKLKDMLKHQAGQHDQSTHTPKRYGRGKRINSERSRELAKQCDPQKKECYTNAFTSLALAGENAKYVEGYTVDNEIGFPFEHGWIETEDEILDPTLIMLDDDLAARYTYFPANEWTHNEVFDEFDAAGSATLPLADMRDPKQQEAFQAAMSHLGFKTKHLAGRDDQRSHGYRYGVGVTMSHLQRQQATMTVEQWNGYKRGAAERLAQLMHIPVVKVLKHLPGQHDQKTHTPKKYGGGAPEGLADHVAEAFDELLGAQPDAKSYNVLSQGEFNARYGSEFGNLVGETAAVTTDDDEIYVAEGNESFGVHELVHATGFMNDGVGTYINEGVTQAATEIIAKSAGVEVAITYQREVEHVRKYLMPATGLSEEEFYRGYARADDKGEFLVDAVWMAHGDEFSNADDWGTDPKAAMYNSIPWTVGSGYQPHLYYLVDELHVTVKHLPGQHDQSTHTPKKYAKGAGRVWGGEQVDAKPTVSKLRTGAVGEDIAMRALGDMLGAEFQTVNVGLNNAPIDVVGNHTAVEVKTGLASNGKTAQHWRATIGQPGRVEREVIAQMTADEKRVHHARKRKAIMDRKVMMLADISKEAGAPIRGMTVGVILAPDGSRGDVFVVSGFHQRLPWKDYATDRYYLGTYKAGEVD